MNQTRKNSIDMLRILAALAVVIFHVLGSSANNDPEIQRNIHYVVTAFSAVLQWHVPVFFMITGYLWLSDGKNCTFEKMVPNIRRFILVLFTFGLGYAIMERFFMTRSVSIALLWSSLQDVLNGNLWDHMWFVYAIIGIYMVLPVFKPFFALSSTKTIALLTGLLCLFTIIFPILETKFDYSIPIVFPIQEYMFYVSPED
ncbi:MAG: acyltransferase [Eubacterium sp.]|nr:acyltransferase [Eubacterium sp.]